MRKIFLLSIFSLFAIIAQAQISHYINYNVTPYYNYFNQESSIPKVKNIFTKPSFSYQIDYKQYGLELYVNTNRLEVDFERLIKNGPMDSKIRIYEISTVNIGLVGHYNFFNQSYLKANAFLGINYNNYVEYHKVPTPSSFALLNLPINNHLGLSTGLNLKAPIYNNLYANGNIRYLYMPAAEYNQHNLFVEIGIGYRIPHTLKRNKNIS